MWRTKDEMKCDDVKWKMWWYMMGSPWRIKDFKKEAKFSLATSYCLHKGETYVYLFFSYDEKICQRGPDIRRYVTVWGRLLVQHLSWQKFYEFMYTLIFRHTISRHVISSYITSWSDERIAGWICYKMDIIKDIIRPDQSSNKGSISPNI